MAVYHQIGHDSMNLVLDKNLSQYKGIVCSPLNYTEEKTISEISRLPDDFEIIFDPQLYFPRTERSKLRGWSYFPDDFETANQSSLDWWTDLCDDLKNVGERIGCTSMCSPSMVPKVFSDAYYDQNVKIGNYFNEVLKVIDIDFLQTVMLNIEDMEIPGRAEEIASIISKTKGNRIYLILKSDIEPRREIIEDKQICGVMKFIKYLKDIDINIFVGFCSSDFLLWKYAGADDFATGKFFNLRRFNSSRFDEPTGGGGQLPYWFEKNLLAYLREGDLLRVKNKNMLNLDCEQCIFSVEILEQLENDPEKPWLGLSWRNYLYTFAKLEAEIGNNTRIIDQLLVKAEKNWIKLEDLNVIMEEMRNDGSWIRKWRIAILEFNKA